MSCLLLWLHNRPTYDVVTLIDLGHLGGAGQIKLNLLIRNDRHNLGKRAIRQLFQQAIVHELDIERLKGAANVEGPFHVQLLRAIVVIRTANQVFKVFRNIFNELVKELNRSLDQTGDDWI